MRTQRAILPGFLFCLLAITRLPCANGQFETSQVPVEATVSSEPVKMQANGHPEGIIHVDVAATDREGKPFSGLAAKDFTLTDNGMPQKIISFAASNQSTDENERLTEVVLVLDEVDLSPLQRGLVKNESIKFLRRNGGHLGEPTSVYWFTTSGLYATAAPTTDGNALAEDVARHNSHRTVWTNPRIRDPFTTAEPKPGEVCQPCQVQSYARWVRSLRAVYSMAIERRGVPGRKLLLWMGFGWLAVHGPEQYKDAAFPWLVELSTRIREARMVISEVTARTEPFTAPYRTIHSPDPDRTDGFRLQRHLQGLSCGGSHDLGAGRARLWSILTFCTSGIGHSERWPGCGSVFRDLALHRTLR